MSEKLAVIKHKNKVPFFYNEDKLKVIKRAKRSEKIQIARKRPEKTPRIAEHYSAMYYWNNDGTLRS